MRSEFRSDTLPFCDVPCTCVRLAAGASRNATCRWFPSLACSSLLRRSWLLNDVQILQSLGPRPSQILHLYGTRLVSDFVVPAPPQRSESTLGRSLCFAGLDHVVVDHVPAVSCNGTRIAALLLGCSPQAFVVLHDALVGVIWPRLCFVQLGSCVAVSHLSTSATPNSFPMFF